MSWRPSRRGRAAVGLLVVASALVVGCAPTEADLILRGGTLYDGSGEAPFVGDVAVNGDSIVAVGDLGGLTGREEVDVRGLAVAPGFINMLSWANERLLHDGRGLSDIVQGVTVEVFGEGSSMGPLNEAMKRDLITGQGDIRYEVPWVSLGEYLEHLEARGVSPNVASFVGASTVRVHELGRDDRSPDEAELERMQDLVRAAMREGALGVGSSLIYAPGFYASTAELVALASAAAEFGGMYVSHLRSEGNSLLEAVDELIEIASAAGTRAEIYHLKAAGRPNWPKLGEAIRRVEAARARGLEITADMYTYTAAATGLDATMPPWVQEGGYDAWVERLADPAVRQRVMAEMRTPSDEWENFLLLAGSPERVLLVGFRADSLKHLTGRTLADIAAERGWSPEETAIELVIRAGGDPSVVYEFMSEENVARQLGLPWMSFGSDAGAMAPEGVFLLSSTHPRAYGNVARLLGRYVRQEGVISLAEAVRRLSALPAENLRLKRRGALRPGSFADVVVFDPEEVIDRATFAEPHQLAVGMRHVWVNGVQVLRDGTHTDAKPGRVLRGPGWEGW